MWVRKLIRHLNHKAEEIMKIVTWNVNSLRARLPSILRYLDEYAPDVVLFQEIKMLTEMFPHDVFEERGYSTHAFGQKTYNGVAIIAKGNIEDPQDNVPTFEDVQARYTEAYIDGKVKVASVYVPNGEDLGTEKYAYKLRFLEAFESHLQDLLKEDVPLCIGGDFNIAPGDADVYDPKRWNEKRILCSPPEREAYQRLLSLGYIDALDVLNPSEDNTPRPEIFTWWDYRTRGWDRGHGLRIDHLLLNSQGHQLLKDGGVHRDIRGWERPSDHGPVWIKLDV